MLPQKYSTLTEGTFVAALNMESIIIKQSQILKLRMLIGCKVGSNPKLTT